MSDVSPSNKRMAYERTNRFRLLLEMIRFSHTLFALPFAILALLWAYRMPLPNGDWVAPGLWPVMGILLCMVFARSSAMAFNRLVDHPFDAENPRTAQRHLPTGQLKRREVWAFTIGCGIGFVAACFCFLPNWLPLAGSVPVLAFLLGYSFAKRITWAAHFWLGTALSLAPLCVWIALRGNAVLNTPADLLPAVFLAGTVASWVAGFDIIYACQDEAFDRKTGLHSIPTKLGISGALHLAAVCHAITVVLLVTLPLAADQLGLGTLYYIAVTFIAGLLLYEHRLVRPDDLQRVNIAFFNINAIISILLLVAAGIDCWLV